MCQPARNSMKSISLINRGKKLCGSKLIEIRSRSSNPVLKLDIMSTIGSINPISLPICSQYKRSHHSLSRISKIMQIKTILSTSIRKAQYQLHWVNAHLLSMTLSIPPLQPFIIITMTRISLKHMVLSSIFSHSIASLQSKK